MNKNIVLICEDIRSLLNVGSMFRTADALGASKLYLCGITGRPPRPEISKAALGAETWIPWEFRAAAWELIPELRKQGFTILALEKTDTSQPIETYKPSYPLAIIVGNEVRGVSRDTIEASDVVVHIPMVGKKESLNVAVAAGIAIHALH